MKNILLAIFLAILATTGYSQIKVISNGKVGVGGINPIRTLEVNGTAAIRGTQLEVGRDAANLNASMRIGFGRASNGSATMELISDASNFPSGGFRFTRTGTGSTQLQHFGTQSFNIRSINHAHIVFNTNGPERMRVHRDGNVGIGTGSPQALLHVNGDIMYNGNLVSSDRRLKSNVNPYRRGLKEILMMKTYAFNYNGLGGIKTDKMQFGIMAQELNEIIPEAVGEYISKEFDEENPNKVLSERTFMYYNPSSILFTLVNAVQEQQQIITNHQVENAQLNKELEELKSQVGEIVELLNQSNQGKINITLHQNNKYKLDQNRPNPFYGNTEIDYILPQNVKQSQMIFYDVNGLVMKQVDLIDNQGTISVSTQTLSSGLYSYSLIVDGKVLATKKMVISK